jgi:large subunit ribosomal protein L31
MKKEGHPKYMDCTVTCGCGSSFKTRSTKPELKVEICSSCHPFFTGQQKYVDAAGRVEKFTKKFGGDYFSKKTAPAKKAPAKA